jgi:Fibronectin type III domain
VRASAGDTLKGDYTETKSAVASPELSPPPQNVNVQPTESGFTVTWDPPTGDYTDSIIEYNIMYWDWNPNDCQFIASAAFESSPAVITDLKPGTNYIVAPVTWNANGQGLPVFANNVVPGAGTPPVPSSLAVHSNGPTTAQYVFS